MKTKNLKLYFLAFAVGIAFVLTNCNKENETLPLQDNSAVSYDLKASGPSANGQGTLLFGDDTRHFTFHARILNNGDVKGNGVVTWTGGGTKAFFDIDCLNIIDDKTAIMSGIVTKCAQVPEFEGKECWFKVIDNGEGLNANPDQITQLHIDLTGDDLEDCFVNYNFDIYEITGGNIQVKP